MENAIVLNTILICNSSLLDLVDFHYDICDNSGDKIKFYFFTNLEN